MMVVSSVFFTIAISVLSLCISLYQLWDSRRRKIKIYFRPHIEIKEELLTHFLIFSVINAGRPTIHISDTRFYLYEKKKIGNRFSLWGQLFSRGRQAYFSSTEGHICDQALDHNELQKITIEAYEIFSSYAMKGKEVDALKLELIDLDGKKYSKKVLLNQLEHDENNKNNFKAFCYPTRFYKYEVKMRKKKVKELKTMKRLQEKTV